MAATGVDVGGREVFQTFVIPLVIIVTDKGGDLCFKVTWQEVFLQQDAVFEGLMPALDLALGLRMVRCPSCVRHSLVFQVFGQFTGDIAGSVV